MNQVAKTIGVDARFYGPIGKGLGRYTQEIVDYIIKLDALNNYVVFLNRHNFDSFTCDGLRVKKVLADLSWYTLAEQLGLPRLIWQYRIDLMHFPHFNVPIFCPVKYIVTIHDLILTKYPTIRATTLNPLIYQLKNLAYKLVINNAVKKSQKIITVSEFTKRDIVDYFKVSPDKVSVVYEGVATLAGGAFVSELDSSTALSCLKRYQITKPYLLYVGNAYPHKNLERLIRVFKNLVQEFDFQLVLVGKIDYFYKRLMTLTEQYGLRSGFKKQVVFTGHVTDLELEHLYRQAKCYVFPSLYEGFGLPPLEAMARSCPVVSSDRASMPEILGLAALYFNPESDEAMLQQIKLMISDATYRERYITLGLEQITRYSWQDSAELTLKIYQSVL